MKKILFLVIMLSCTCCTTFATSDGNLNQKLNLQDASAVTKKANDASKVHGNSLLSNPVYNAMTGGVGNFMHGINDNPTNVYSMQEQSRQETEYLRQGQ
ncbi:hypothetical protein KBA27_03795 [bacterium]|nr:hypothetical protein [bacterium]